MLIAELYPRHFDEIVRFALKLTRNRASAEDVTQETFLRAMRNSHLLMEMSEAKARAWLYTTARNIAIDQIRRVARAPVLSGRDRHDDDLSGIVVQSVMNVLTDEERRLVSLRHFADMDSTQIGGILGLPPATVRTRLRAAAKKLRKAYWAGEGGDEHGTNV